MAGNTEMHNPPKRHLHSALTVRTDPSDLSSEVTVVDIDTALFVTSMISDSGENKSGVQSEVHCIIGIHCF